MRQIILDTETTGLSPESGDRIIEIGCVELVNRRLTGNDLHFYVNPERRNSVDAFKVHGLSDEFLADKPIFAHVAERLLAFVEGAEIIIHNAAFDVGFLDAELRRIGRRDRKGAPDTFDRAGYAALLGRLRSETGTVYAPAFDRAIEDSIAAAVPVPADVPLVVTEGNYLLLWPELRPLLDLIWYLDPPPHERQAALVARHVAFGKSAAQAQRWVRESDERNAELIAAGRQLADLVLGWTG